MPSTPEGRTTLPCWWGGRCGRIQVEASGLSDLMAAPDLVILSTRVATGEGVRPAAVAIADGVITAVHEHGGPPEAARQLDVGDAALLPAVVVFGRVPERDLWHGMVQLAALGLASLVHAELAGATARAAPSLGSDPRRYGSYLASRPRAAELEAVELMLDLCRETGCPVHIVHVSAADTLARLRRARDAGLRVTAETCPHYLTFPAEELLGGATAWECAPPIRERSNRERLWEGLADGTLDLVASDHSPAPPELKCLDTGDFVRAWGGVASLEVGLAATWTGARDRGRDLGDLARWCAERPARLAGLTRKGRIAPGCDADLIVFDPDARFSVEPERLRQRHPVTPYAGMVLQGVVRQTFVRGTCVYDQGEFPTPGIGRWVR